MKKTILAIFIILAVFAMGLSVGFYYGKAETQSNQPEDLDFSLFWQAWDSIEQYYVDKDKIDYQQMIYGAIKGMTESLEDPYTVFMDPEDLRVFEQETAGEFEGIGIEIGIRENQLTVIAPLAGTPAERAGLKAGDKIVKIDNTDTRNMSVDMAASLIRGPKNTKVTLTILREARTETEDFVITRDVIEVPSLQWELMEDNIAYIKLYRFTRTAGSDFDAAAAEILASPAQKIILDLRNNTGGYLDVAQHIAGWFLEKNAVVAIEEIGVEKEGKVYTAKGPSKLIPYPTVILINRGSASASEILAGALRDNRGIKLIGEKTFGKGSIQEVRMLKEGGMKITTARWLTPAGNLINEIGLEPDVTVDLTETRRDSLFSFLNHHLLLKSKTDDKIFTARDPHLNKALEVLKEIR